MIDKQSLTDSSDEQGQRSARRRVLRDLLSELNDILGHYKFIIAPISISIGALVGALIAVTAWMSGGQIPAARDGEVDLSSVVSRIEEAEDNHREQFGLLRQLQIESIRFVSTDEEFKRFRRRLVRVTIKKQHGDGHAIGAARLKESGFTVEQEDWAEDDKVEMLTRGEKKVLVLGSMVEIDDICDEILPAARMVPGVVAIDMVGCHQDPDKDGLEVGIGLPLDAWQAKGRNPIELTKERWDEVCEPRRPRAFRRKIAELTRIESEYCSN